MPRKPTDEADGLEPPSRGIAAIADSDPGTAASDAHEITLRPPQLEQADPTFWSVEARVVYLGNHPQKSVYLRGSVREMIDPRDPSGQRVLYLPSMEGATTYDFSALDTRGRPISERRTPRDGRPWTLCRHIGHLAWFLRHEGPDQAPEFLVRATPEVAEKIQRYTRSELEHERREIDRGRPVLVAMGLA
jgi:hypothetical protein